MYPSENSRRSVELAIDGLANHGLLKQRYYNKRASIRQDAWTVPFAIIRFDGLSRLEPQIVSCSVQTVSVEDPEISAKRLSD